MWWRIFGRNDTTPDLAALLEHLHAHGLPVSAAFRGDDLGWTGGTLTLPTGESMTLERYLTKEDDLRDELNTWAAWLEMREQEPRRQELMQHVIGTRQLATLRAAPDDTVLTQLCTAVCQFLARQTEGMYQADGQGFFAADGSPLLREMESGRPADVGRPEAFGTL